MKCILLLPLIMLGACDRGERVEPPTAAEAERLNEAEDMLNELADEEAPTPAREARLP